MFQKTKFMVFCIPQKNVVIPILKIANTENDSVDRLNFLGVQLDKQLSWDAHTNILVGKISRTTGILNYGILAWVHNNNRV